MTNPTVLAAAKHWRITPEDILGQDRRKMFIVARCAVSHVMSKRDGLSLTHIGRMMGGRDHTTIMNQLRRAERLLASDPGFRRFVEFHLTLPRFNRATVIQGFEPAVPEKTVRRKTFAGMRSTEIAAQRRAEQLRNDREAVARAASRIPSIEDRRPPRTPTFERVIDEVGRPIILDQSGRDQAEADHWAMIKDGSHKLAAALSIARNPIA